MNIKPNDWVRTLSAGDLLFVKSNSIYSSLSLHTVKRLTKTLVVLDNEYRFRKKDGVSVGSSDFIRSYLVQATPELMASVATRRIRKQRLAVLSGTEWRLYPDEFLGKILTLIEKEKKPDEVDAG